MTANIADLPDLLLTLDEFTRLQKVAECYAAEATRCWRSPKVDPGFSSKTDPAVFVVHG